MKFVLLCVAIMAGCMIAAELTAGEINPIQKSAVQKCPGGVCQKAMQKSDCVQKSVYKTTWKSRIQRLRETRGQNRVRVSVCVGSYGR